MTAAQRFKTILWSLLTILCAAGMIYAPDVGYSLVILFLALSLLCTGLSSLLYYFNMARYMVGGKIILYKSVIILDFGIFTLLIAQAPQASVMIYLLICYMFSGIIKILRAHETRKLEAGSWKVMLSNGIFDLALAVVCGIFLKSMRTLVYIYSFGLICSALVNIGKALKRTAIVYIQ